MTIDNPPSADGKDSLYNDGYYLAQNPGWHMVLPQRRHLALTHI